MIMTIPVRFIHPFLDGNGRTSRLLMNLVLMRAGFPPVIIRRADRWRCLAVLVTMSSHHREVYYRHLQTANEGDVRPFVRFIALCTEKTLEAYLWASKEYTMEVEQDREDGGMSELPPNLVEHTAEQVDTGLRSYLAGRGRSAWFDFADDQQDGVGATIQLGDGRGAKEAVVLTMDDDDMLL
jgi:hypothetical protein